MLTRLLQASAPGMGKQGLVSMAERARTRRLQPAPAGGHEALLSGSMHATRSEMRPHLRCALEHARLLNAEPTDFSSLGYSPYPSTPITPASQRRAAVPERAASPLASAARAPRAEAPAAAGDRGALPAAVRVLCGQRRRQPAAAGRRVPGPRPLRPHLLQPGPGARAPGRDRRARSAQ
jgi:hypothetical protein